MSSELEDAVARYRDRFGESPPFAMFSNPEDCMEAIKEALNTGQLKVLARAPLSWAKNRERMMEPKQVLLETVHSLIRPD